MPSVFVLGKRNIKAARKKGMKIRQAKWLTELIDGVISLLKGGGSYHEQEEKIVL